MGKKSGSNEKNDAEPSTAAANGQQATSSSDATGTWKDELKEKCDISIFTEREKEDYVGVFQEILQGFKISTSTYSSSLFELVSR
jgi:hypothetical protein